MSINVNDLLFMADLFKAVKCGEHETYIKFTCKSYSDAVKFSNYLGNCQYHRSGIVGHDRGDWQITIWR